MKSRSCKQVLSTRVGSRVRTPSREIMAGTMVSASTGAMNSLLRKLTTLMGEEYARLKGVRKEVESLDDEFSSMKALLEKLVDMDELDPLAVQWRNQVKDMSFDIEDCIDDFMHHLNKKDATAAGLVEKIARQLNKIRVRHQISGKIQEIKARLKEVDERRRRYNLDAYNSHPTNVLVDPRIVAIHTEASNLLGIDVPREELSKLLMGEERELKVASVVGFGGLGKTTLANQVYCKLKEKFECKAFVSVSQKPDIPKLLSKILLEIGGCFSHTGVLDDIENIKNHLRDKRYFIVIDDLWDASAWKIIKCAFPENNRGSRVLTTTRIYDVALACCSYSKHYVYNMRPLCEKNSRRLFFSRIFGSSRACPEAFEELSTDILKKCGGLPLAIISIASLLAGQSSIKWEYVRNSLGSMFEGNPNLEDMMRILDLSYKNLPNHLKTCLLYISMYPEDHIIKKDDLLRQWVAEGFISEVQGLDAEDVARSYFNELINTNMIQAVETGYNDEVLSCRIHDLMLDVIKFKSAEENFIDVIDDLQATVHNKTRRISLHRVVASGNIAITINGSVSQVRSVVAFTEISMSSLQGFKYVRVLQLKFLLSRRGQKKVDLTGICGLFLLRYLKIVNYSFKLELPNQFWGLQYLETMDLKLQIGKITIPTDICRLRRLSHLIVPSGTKFHGGIGTMKSLRTLDAFDISCSSLDSIMSLGELTNLRDLVISCPHCCYIEDIAMHALQTSLERLAYSGCRIKSLVLLTAYKISYSYWFHTSPVFPCKLQRLHLDIVFPRIPKWIAQLRDLCSLKLMVRTVVAKDDDIGILAGLPSLVYLQFLISRDQEERIVIPNTNVAFPVLKHLHLVCTQPLLAFEAGALARLQTLEVMLLAKGWEDVGHWLLQLVATKHLPVGLNKIVISNLMMPFYNENMKSALTRVFSMLHPGIDLSFSLPVVKNTTLLLLSLLSSRRP